MSKLQYDSIEDFMRDMETRKAKFEQQTESVSLADLKAGKLPAAPEAKLEPGLPPEPEEATPPNVQTSEPVQVPEPLPEIDVEVIEPWEPEWPVEAPRTPEPPKPSKWTAKKVLGMIAAYGLIIGWTVWWWQYVDAMTLESCFERAARYGVEATCDGSWNGETHFIFWFMWIGVMMVFSPKPDGNAALGVSVGILAYAHLSK